MGVFSKKKLEGSTNIFVKDLLDNGYQIRAEDSNEQIYKDIDRGLLLNGLKVVEYYILDKIGITKNDYLRFSKEEREHLIENNWEDYSNLNKKEYIDSLLQKHLKIDEQQLEILKESYNQELQSFGREILKPLLDACLEQLPDKNFENKDYPDKKNIIINLQLIVREQSCNLSINNVTGSVEHTIKVEKILLTCGEEKDGFYNRKLDGLSVCCSATLDLKNKKFNLKQVETAADGTNNEIIADDVIMHDSKISLLDYQLFSEDFSLFDKYKSSFSKHKKTNIAIIATLIVGAVILGATPIGWAALGSALVAGLVAASISFAAAAIAPLVTNFVSKLFKDKSEKHAIDDDVVLDRSSKLGKSISGYSPIPDQPCSLDVKAFVNKCHPSDHDDYRSLISSSRSGSSTSCLDSDASNVSVQRVLLS